MAAKSTVAETIRLFRSFYDRGPRLDEIIDFAELRAEIVDDAVFGARLAVHPGCP